MYLKKSSVFKISSMIFIIGYLFIISSNKDILHNKSQDDCFILFFITGMSAVMIYNITKSIL